MEANYICCSLDGLSAEASNSFLVFVRGVQGSNAMVFA